jgi:hypothetical protein
MPMKDAPERYRLGELASAHKESRVFASPSQRGAWKDFEDRQNSDLKAFEIE